jgi:23S rRNA (cytosine1962-C5)-methyltransferase
MPNKTIVIKAGREKPIRQQHPWIFSGAIARAENADPGDIVTVVSQDGEFLARGYWNQKSQIQVRILTWRNEEIDDQWWRNKIQRALETRGLDHIAYEQGDNPDAAFRMINAENDYLPGLIVDRYGDWLVLQALTLAIDQRKTMIAELLAAMVTTKGVYERSDVDVREREGLPLVTGVLWGEEPPQLVTIDEAPVKINIDIRNGHKTGFYLDQKNNRQLLCNFISEDFTEERRLLNLFSYTGGFALHALSVGGVHAVNVDSSEDALKLAEQNMTLNGFDQNANRQTYEFVQDDVFDYLRKVAAQGEQYDIVVLDPPKFAHNKRQIEKAARGYKDINLNAFKVIKPGGYLLTFSCSGAIDADLFQKIVFGALADSGRQAQILRHLEPGEDHPVALTFPEGAYLKGLLLRVY